jgi:hypothetical protein
MSSNLSETDARIYTALARDPQARRVLAPEVRRLVPEVPLPEYDAQIANEKAISEAVRPLQERLEQMEKEKKERDSNEYWQAQRGILKTRYGYNDKQVSEFEERLAKEFKNGQLDYGDLHAYFQSKDYPLPPGNVNIGLNGSARGQLEQEWRAQMKNPETNPGSRAFKGDRREYFRNLWNKAQEDLPR